MKVAIFVFLVFGFSSFGEHLKEVGVIELKQFNKEVVKAKDFRGSFQEFVNEKGLINNESTQAELLLKGLKENNNQLKSAKAIARYVHSLLFPNISLRAPFPCGARFVGSIEENSKLVGKDSNIQYYVISGSGSKYENSCIGASRDLKWSYKIEVEYAPNAKNGFLSFEMSVK